MALDRGPVRVARRRSGFRRIVFLNGHYDNTYAIAYACAAAAERCRRAPAPSRSTTGTACRRGGRRVLRPATGLHANRAETSAVMAINPALVDLDAANAEMPPFPEVTNVGAGPHGVLLLVAGLRPPATQSGTWGDARESSAEYGERYLDVVTEATIRMLDDIERTFAAMPAR